MGKNVNLNELRRNDLAWSYAREIFGYIIALFSVSVCLLVLKLFAGTWGYIFHDSSYAALLLLGVLFLVGYFLIYSPIKISLKIIKYARYLRNEIKE